MMASRRSGTKQRANLGTKRTPAKKNKTKAKAKPKAKPKAIVKAKPKAIAKAKPKATAKAKPKAITKAKPKATAKAKPKAITKAKPKAIAKAKPKAIAKAKPKATAKAKAPASAKPGAKAAAKQPAARPASASPMDAAAAVEAAFAARAGDAKLFSWGVRQTWAEGGEDPLEKVRAYACDDETPHWHYVTSGLADPEKIDLAPGSPSSGLGYELSLRLARAADETEAPGWPVYALQELGWGILKARMKLGAGHYVRRRTVITGGDPPTALNGYYLLADPQLPAITSRSGAISFLQLVGITEDELLQCEAGEPDALEAELIARSPLGITDITRTTPGADEDPHVRLGALQRAFGEQCRAIIPDGVTQFSVSATLKEGNLDCAVEAPIPFALGARAEAALRRIFLSQAAAGQSVEQLRAELAAKPDSSWSTVLEFDYADRDTSPN
jgi:hypothetical protein